VTVESEQGDVAVDETVTVETAAGDVSPDQDDA
jgi:hypothetical protein